MVNENTIEQRLVNLERTVAQLKYYLQITTTTNNWLKKVTGSISDEQAFLEVLEYGKSFREADKPTDEV